MTARNFEQIVNAIREINCAENKLPSERALAEMLGIKRHQLRKALVHLREAGEIDESRQPRVERQVSKISESLVHITNPLEVIEMRLILEPGMARLASLRASAPEIEKLKASAKTPADASSGEVDYSFHLAIARAAKNSLAIEFYKMLRQVGKDARVRVNQVENSVCPKRVMQRDAEHMRIAEAIATRSPDEAESAMHAHLMSVQKRINDRSSAEAA